MEHTRYESLKEVFLAACEVEAARRAEFLEQACGSDIPLKLEVERLLRAHDESPAGGVPIPAVADRIGRYRILGLLGAGGMGTVYEAEQDSPRRPVALKVLRGLPFFDDLTPRLFQREGQALARLQHPGIAAIYEAGRTEDGWHYFAMELVRGAPLNRYVREHHLSLRDKLTLFTRICEAVHYAHQKGVIHRDLKPSNILVADGKVEKSKSQEVESEPHPPHSPLDKGGQGGLAQPKVLDFGLARLTDPDGELTTRASDAGGIWGTLAYMSPEQARGQSDQIDVRCDVYALGVVLYEMLAGRLPYDVCGVPLPAAVRIICEQAPTPLRAAGFTPALLRMRGRESRHRSAVRASALGALTPAARLDADLETIVARALEKDPSRRYASVSQLASDITRYLRNEPIAARPASAWYQLRKLAARHRLPFMLAAGLVMAISGFAVVAAVQAVRISAERDKAVAAQQGEAEARATAEEAAAFLEKLFEQGIPGAQDSTNPTVRDLLEAGVARLDEKLADQPLIYARLAQALGTTYKHLANYPQANSLLESALDIRKRELGGAHPDVAKSLEALADLLVRTGGNDRSYALRLQALEILRSHHDGAHEDVAAALEAVGSDRFYAQDYAVAVDYFQQCLDIRRALGSPDLQVGIALNNLGAALEELGRLDEAEAALRESLDLKRRAAKRNDKDDAIVVGLSLEALAFLEHRRGRSVAAEEYCRQQVEAVRNGCPPTSPAIAWALNNYAFLVKHNHGPARAEPIYREALAIRIAAVGEQHPEVADTLSHLAQVRLGMDDPEGALELIGKALDIYTAAQGRTHDTVAYGLLNQTQAYRRLGDLDRAEAALLESYAILAANHGEFGKPTVGPVKILIALYDESGECDLADPWRETLARIEAGG